MTLSECCQKEAARGNAGNILGDGLGPDAIFWRTYREEAVKSDDKKIEGWNSSLDVLLIFAGLFSAVQTTFLIESYQQLLPDYVQFGAQVQYASLLILSGTPSTLSVWTNGLWFISLVLGLATALVCIVAKQWLSSYREFRAKSGVDWVHRTIFRYDNLHEWRVEFIIAVLPVILHLSLFLFFTGLILFITPLNLRIAWTCGWLAGLLFLCYATSLMLPITHVDCPYRLPLMQMTGSWARIKDWARLPTIRVSVGAWIEELPSAASSSLQRWSPLRLSSAFTSVKIWVSRPPPRPMMGLRPKKYQETNSSFSRREHAVLRKEAAALTTSAIRWIISSSPNPSSVSLAVQAVGDLHPRSTEIENLAKLHHLESRIKMHISSKFAVPLSTESHPLRLSEEQLVLYMPYLRSMQILFGHRRFHGSNYPFLMTHIQPEIDLPDVQLTLACGHWIEHCREPSIVTQRTMTTFFRNETQRRWSNEAIKSSSRYSWPMVVHTLRIFSAHRCKLQEDALRFIVQEVMDHLSTFTQEMAHVAHDLRVIVGGDETWLTRPVNQDILHEYVIATWCGVLMHVNSTANAGELQRLATFLIHLIRPRSRLGISICDAPQLLEYLRCDAFRSLMWTDEDLAVLHGVIQTESRNNTANSPASRILVSTSLNLVRYAAIKASSTDWSLSFLTTAAPWLLHADRLHDSRIIATFITLYNSEPTIWENICAAGSASLALGFLGAVLASSIVVQSDTLPDTDQLMDVFLRSCFFDRLCEALSNMSEVQVEDPEYRRAFVETWLVALRAAVALQPDWLGWDHVRHTFLSAANARPLFTATSFNWTMYEATAWLQNWLGPQLGYNPPDGAL
ncbi:hypothetical protein BKA62DRAFT_23388 [Auriculariales sp. MPI-PUGE-AT-0066]|nr:hypothetical protein BKA62DRAFT_23388 [Auriculariales sp. MPI-PUGE-AT-0066]